MEQEEEKKKQKKKKILFAGLGTITAGVLGFFGWQWYKGRKQSETDSNSKAGFNTPANNNGSSYAPSQDTARNSYHAPASQGNDGFPLKNGSKGAKVKALQQALINRYGASILPRYGADGAFGNEVAAALKKEGLPSTIDENTYAVIVGNNGASSGSGSGSGADAVKIAADLHDSIDNTDYSKAMSSLKQMGNVQDYKNVRTEFEKTRIGFTHETPVNALMETFGSNETQKVNIKLEFLRMGLLYDKTKDQWSLPAALSGLPYKLITKTGIEVMDKNGKNIAVAGNTLLGHPIGMREGWVYFFPFNADVLLRVKKQDVTIKNNND